MNSLKLGTKIHTETDFAVTALVMSIDGDSRLMIACELLGKNPADYAHLDKGRRSMTGANLLRGAARKDPTFVNKVRSAVERNAIIDSHAVFTACDKKLVEDELASFDVEGEGSIEIDWPKSTRFQFAQRQDNGEWKFFYKAPKEGSYFTR